MFCRIPEFPKRGATLQCVQVCSEVESEFSKQGGAVAACAIDASDVSLVACARILLSDACLIRTTQMRDIIQQQHGAVVAVEEEE